MLTLVKFESLKAILDLEKAAIDDYPALQELQKSVYYAIESYLGRYLEQDTYTEKAPVSGNLVPLKALPVSTVSAAVLSSGVDLVAEVEIVYDGIRLPYKVSSSLVETTYVGGFDTVPGDITRAALLQVIHEWQRKEHVGATSVTNEGGSIQWPELTLLTEVKRLLDPYVHPARLI